MVDGYRNRLGIEPRISANRGQNHSHGTAQNRRDVGQSTNRIKRAPGFRLPTLFGAFLFFAVVENLNDALLDGRVEIDLVEDQFPLGKRPR